MEDKKVEVVQDMQEAQNVKESVETKPEVTQLNILPKVEDKDENEEIFVSEKDLFDCEIKYYKENGVFVVEGVDDNFVLNKADKTLSFSCKYPSITDLTTIMNAISGKDVSHFKTSDYVLLELARLSLLLRKWSLKQDINRIHDINPKFVKAMIVKVQEKIGMQGLV